MASKSIVMIVVIKSYIKMATITVRRAVMKTTAEDVPRGSQKIVVFFAYNITK